MKFAFNPFSYFKAPQAAPETSPTAGQGDSSGSMPHPADRQALPSRPAPRQSEDPAMPPPRRRAGLRNEAGQSRLELLESDLVHKIAIDGRLSAQDVASMSETSKAMKAVSASAWSYLYRRSAAGIAQSFLAVRSLADLKEALSLLENSGLARDRHEQLLASLDIVIQRLPAPERLAAIAEFARSVDVFNGPFAMPEGNIEVGHSVLASLRSAAEHGLPGWERFVKETHGRPAIIAGENAQDVARRLGVDSKRLEQMSAWRGSRSIPAGPAYRAVTETREDFDRILQRFGIVDPEVVAELDAAHKSPQAAVTRGDNVQDVARRFNIRDRNEVFRLAEASVSGPAGRAVLDGMNPEEAAWKFGVDQVAFMTMRLQDIAKGRDARAAAGQSVAGRALRGAGNLLRGVAVDIFNGVLESGPRMAVRTAARSLLGNPDAVSPGAAMAAVQATFLAGRVGHARAGHRPGNTAGDRMERNQREFERELRRLPLRADQPGQHLRQADESDSDED